MAIKYSPEELTDAGGVLSNPTELCCYAALATAVELAWSWSAALADGETNTHALMADVTEVIELLQKWREAVVKMIKEDA